MPARFSSKGASIKGAPFACGLLLLLHSQLAPGGACPARDSSERVTVVHVYDGDTVKLADGRRVRLVGINAPEVRGDHQPGKEPFANEARAALERLINGNNRILLLQYGEEDEDHYGRLLAHAFLDNGDNVAVRLLQAGLATTLVVPPNTWAYDCYRQQEDRARIERRGLWDHPRYRVLDSRNLPASTRGFRIIHATVQRLRYAGGTAWLELDGPLTVRVGKQDQVNFPTGYLEHLAGQAVEIRGWVRGRPSDLVLTVRHPAALAAINTRAP
jgi:endonuclease YncB( thermonuclease family)